MSTVKNILIYGGKGALGSACVSHFKKHNWWVMTVDLAENPDANANVVLKSSSLTEQESELLTELSSKLGDTKLDALVCVAGGWAGGNAASEDCIGNTDLMIKQSLWSSCLAAKAAAKHLNEGGLLVLTGAKAALEATPGMIGYGLAKAAVHHLTKSLAAPKSGLPKESTVLAILPVTLDTPMNRKFMPKADHSSWTPLDFVASTFYSWATKSAIERPESGSLVSLTTEKGETKLKVVDK